MVKMRRKIFILAPMCALGFTFIIAGLSILFNLLLELLCFLNAKFRDCPTENNIFEKQRKIFYTCGIVFSFFIILVIFSIVLEAKGM